MKIDKHGRKWLSSEDVRKLLGFSHHSPAWRLMKDFPGVVKEPHGQKQWLYIKETDFEALKSKSNRNTDFLDGQP